MAFDARGFRGYLFDLDGTLIDTAPDICAAVNHALGHFGYAPASESVVRHWVGFGGRACIEQALAAAEQCAGAACRNAPPAAADGNAQRTDGGNQGPVAPREHRDNALIEEMLDRFLNHYGEHIADASRPYPGVVDALRILSERQRKLAVVTNKRMELTGSLLAELELAHFFDVIVGGDSTPHPKPAPDPILFACREIGLAPAEVLFVGDSEADVQSARSAGCPVVCVPDGYNHGIAADRLGADAVIESMAELVCAEATA